MEKVNIKLNCKKEVASNTMTFHFDKPEGFTFKAGQFADYTLIHSSDARLMKVFLCVHTTSFDYDSKSL